jgi:hypothetical protein
MTISECWVIARETVIDDLPGRPRLGYSILAPSSNGATQFFESSDAAIVALRSMPRPLGWVVMRFSQFITQNWFHPDTAPKDNTLLLLLVIPDDHATEDAPICRTIGGNNLANDGLDQWQFAGWNWCQDEFTQGTGSVIGWLPLPRFPINTMTGDRTKSRA